MFRKLALAAAISMLAVSCSADSQTTTPDGTPSDVSADTSSEAGDADEGAAAASGVESLDDLEFESPIAEFLGVDTSYDFDGDEAQAEYAAQEAEAEDQIAICMAAEGFEYNPVDRSEFVSFGANDSELPYFSDKWIAKYGFGITTQWFSQSNVGANLVGYDDSAFQDEREAVDPNQEYVSSLSSAEADAYFDALYGTEPELPDNPTEEEIAAVYDNFIASGCRNEAYADTDGASAEFAIEFGDELEALNERVQADPRVDAHNSRVSACVAERGFEYTSLDDLYGRWDADLEALVDDPFLDANNDLDSMIDAELDAFFADYDNSLSDEAKVTLGEIQAEEIELALVVVECGGGPLNDEVVVAQVRVEYEQEFIDNNRERLSGFENTVDE